MFYVKIHKIDAHRNLVSVCDEKILGEKFCENNLQLDLNCSFYRGELMEEEKMLPLLKKAYTFNIVGKDIITLALKKNLISKENIIKIKNIPHAQGLLIDDSQNKTPQDDE
ncbi:MAG: DUF424 family protein [Nanoarchaeota archaeon]|nr:DUF424 family protein [Nanoarchaeota archaeon]